MSWSHGRKTSVSEPSDDSTVCADPAERWVQPLRFEVLVDRLPRPSPVVVVVHDQYTTGLKAREEVLEFVTCRLVPVGDEPEKSDSLGDGAGDGRLHGSLDEPDELVGVSGRSEVGPSILK